MSRRRKHWGWGYEDEIQGAAELAASAQGLSEHLGFGSPVPADPVPLERIPLRPSRLPLPETGPLGLRVSAEPWDRVRHGLGCSYGDVVRGFRGQVPRPPDLVAYPRDEEGVVQVLEFAAEHGAAVVPYGGGTSVVGGIEPRFAKPSIALNLSRLDRVVEVDRLSRAARIQAGATGPGLEAQLAEHGMTMRFYPQSFELSTLGGWIATRAAGHFATGPTHVDDLVQSVRALTAAGAVWESRRLPGSGAGPSPDRLLLGSEGTLAVVTEAWVRVQPKPSVRRSATVRFDSFAAGCAAVREIVQSGLRPANLRLVDADEAKLTFAGDGTSALLVLGFESTGAPVDDGFAHALALCRAAGGTPDPEREGEGAGGAWRAAFLQAPYVRDTFVAMGVLSETFETAITWDALDGFVGAVRGAAASVLHEVCGGGTVTVRLTHAYPDGAAPYFTCIAPARPHEEVAQWEAVKRAASDAILAAGGTITHHHAVGRDHRPWYDQQRPEPFAAALRAAKTALDPAGMLNPGVLVDPAGARAETAPAVRRPAP